MGAGRCTAAPAGSRRTRTGAISSCSTNTSTATTARGSARATRPDGRASSRVPCTCSRPPPPSRLSSLARTLRPSRRRRRRPRAVAGGPDMSPAYPSLYQVNTRVLLTALSRTLGRPATLDDIPDHMALDHPWVEDHPDYYVGAGELEPTRAPQNYTWVKRMRGDVLLAHGRDPYFDGWPDTLQLDYANPATQEAMIGELLVIAGQCDGVRCDMAMLVLPDVFERTWGRRAPLFWPNATRRVRERVSGFRFMAEVYWDLEWTTLQQGFDYAYDKRLYDRLREGHARPVREHLYAGLDYQNRLARFLENHDEPRAAATFAPGMHEAAAVITYLSPGLRFF